MGCLPSGAELSSKDTQCLLVSVGFSYDVTQKVQISITVRTPGKDLTLEAHFTDVI